MTTFEIVIVKGNFKDIENLKKDLESFTKKNGGEFLGDLETTAYIKNCKCEGKEKELAKLLQKHLFSEDSYVNLYVSNENSEKLYKIGNNDIIQLRKADIWIISEEEYKKRGKSRELVLDYLYQELEKVEELTYSYLELFL